MELRKETTRGLQARGSVFQLNFSLSQKPLYRLADPLSSQQELPASVYHAETLTRFEPNHTSHPDCGSS